MLPECKDWRSNIVEDVEGIRQVLLATKRVAVLGIRSEKDCTRPAFYVPQYLISAGLQVIPVPLHDLKVHKILDQRVFRRLTDIPGELDLVDVFRRSEDIQPMSMTCSPKDLRRCGFSQEYGMTRLRRPSLTLASKSCKTAV